MPEPVIKTVDVACGPDAPFRVFVHDIDRWWPKDRHSVSAMQGVAARSVTLEPRAGGAIYEIAPDGTHHPWGEVVRFEPPALLSIRWHVTRPAAQATRIDVAFEPRAGGTRVTLRHDGWEALGADAPGARDSYDAGWVLVFETAFAGVCATRAA